MAFVASKIFWFLFNPGTLLVLGLLFGYLAGLAPWARLRRLGRIVLGAALAAMLAVAVLPIGSWLTVPLEERFPAPDVMPEEIAGIVVLGGAFHLRRSADRGSAQLNQSAERMIAFAEMARRFPEARLLFTGGSGSLRDSAIREGDFVPGLMAALGIDPKRVLIEREARNTRENAIFAKRLVKAPPGETWLLVTSAFHMPRAMGVFRATGWELVPYPVDYQTSGPGHATLGFGLTGSLRLLSLGLHEWLGLAAYRILGWSAALFPAPQTKPVSGG